MGRYIQSSSNPDLAQEHPAGSIVQIVQPLVHDTLGGITFAVPDYWQWHYRQAESACLRLDAYHAKLQAMPVGSDKSRGLLADDYLFGIYRTGGEMVINVSLTAQHLAHEMERIASLTPPRHGSAVARLDTAARKVRLTRPSKHAGYSGLVEMVKVRDRLEHPKKKSNPTNPGAWDEVPLAWMLSERPFPAFRRFESLMIDLVNEWASVRKRFSRKQTLSVERGIQFDHQAKKQSSKS